MANKLTDEQFYAQMDKIKQLGGFNPLDEIDALNTAEYGVQQPPTQQPVADTSILGLMERGEGVVGDFMGGLLGGPASNWRDNLQQDTNVNPYVAGKDVLNQANVNFLDSAKTSLGGGADLVANPKQTVQSIADLSSGALQHALPDSMSWNEDDKAMASMAGQQIKEDWTTAEGFQKMLAERPAEVFPAFYGAGILGKIAGGKARDVLNSEAVLSKVEPMSRAIDPTNLGPSSEMVLHHGSQSKFDKFDHDKMGSGEGNQSYGWGTYLAEHPDVAGGYQNRLSGNDKLNKLTSNGEPIPFSVKGDTSESAFIVLLKNEGDVNKTLKELDDRATNSPIKGIRDKSAKERDFLEDYANNNELKFDKKGSFYDVDVPDEYIGDMIDLDLDIASQSEKVRDTLIRLRKEFGTSFHDGQGAYDAIVFEMRRQGHKNPEMAASKYLDAQGIKGSKFLDQDSRNSNYMLSTPDETTAGDWMVKDNRKPNSFGKHFDNEADAQKFLDEKSNKTRNFVIFNEDNMKIIKRDGEDINVDDGLLKQEPLTVYRSSTSGSYDKFDKSKQKSALLGQGVYMFDNEKSANDWVGGNLQKIELPYDYMEKSINWGDGGQSDFVTKAFKKIEKEVDFKLDLEDGGIDVYPELVKKLGENKAQALLSKHGIYGNRRDYGNKKDQELTIFNVDDAKIISTDKKKPKNGLLD